MAETSEKKMILGEEIEVWPEHCVNNNKCAQCVLEGKIRCHPQFWPKTTEETVETELKPKNWNTMNRLEKGHFFNAHRAEIEQDLKTLGSKGTRGKWVMLGSTLSTLKRRWQISTKDTPPAADQERSTGIPPVSTEKPPGVQEKAERLGKLLGSFPNEFLLEEFTPGPCAMCGGPLFKDGSASTITTLAGAKIYVCNGCKLGAVRLFRLIDIKVKEMKTTPAN